MQLKHSEASTLFLQEVVSASSLKQNTRNGTFFVLSLAIHHPEQPEVTFNVLACEGPKALEAYTARLGRKPPKPLARRSQQM